MLRYSQQSSHQSIVGTVILLSDIFQVTGAQYIISLLGIEPCLEPPKKVTIDLQVLLLRLSLTLTLLPCFGKHVSAKPGQDDSWNRP